MGLFDSFQLSHVKQSALPLEDYVNIGTQYANTYMKNTEMEDQFQAGMTDLIYNAAEADRQAVSDYIGQYGQRMDQRIQKGEYWNPGITRNIRKDALEFSMGYKKFMEDKAKRDADIQSIMQNPTWGQEQKEKYAQLMRTRPGVQVVDGVLAGGYESLPISNQANWAELADRAASGFKSDGVTTGTGTYKFVDEDPTTGRPGFVHFNETTKAWESANPEEIEGVVEAWLWASPEAIADLQSRGLIDPQSRAALENGEMPGFVKNVIHAMGVKHGFWRESNISKSSAGSVNWTGVNSGGSKTSFTGGIGSLPAYEIDTNPDTWEDKFWKFFGDYTPMGTGSTYNKSVAENKTIGEMIDKKFDQNATTIDILGTMPDRMKNVVNGISKEKYGKLAADIKTDELREIYDGVIKMWEQYPTYLNTNFYRYDEKTSDAMSNAMRRDGQLEAKRAWDIDKGEWVKKEEFVKMVNDGAKFEVHGMMDGRNPYWLEANDVKLRHGTLATFGDRNIIMTTDRGIVDMASANPAIRLQDAAFQSMINGGTLVEIPMGGGKVATVRFSSTGDKGKPAIYYTDVDGVTKQYSGELLQQPNIPI